MRLTILLLPLLLAGCATMNTATPPLRTVPYVDLDRYMGRWNVIANIPYFLEKGKVATADIYTKRPDGRIENVFAFRKDSFDSPEKTWNGVAWVTNTTTNAEWKVRFIWPVSSSYLILELDPDYRWAVVGTPGRNLLWVLARDRALPDDVYRSILDRVAKQGYDPTRLAKVPQPGT